MAVRAGAPLSPHLLSLPEFPDTRGVLVAGESGMQIPFDVRRWFVIRDVPEGGRRARHAQRQGHEVLSCVAGSCVVDIESADRTQTHRLTSPAAALYVPPWTWIECRDFTAGAVLLVLCSHPYDPMDQISDYREFRAGPP